MKKIPLLILIAATITGCKKEKDSGKGFISKWELRASNGDFVGPRTYPPGNGSIVEFKNDGSFTVYASGTIINSGTYELQPGEAPDRFTIIYHSQGSANTTQYVVLQGDTLELYFDQPCCSTGGSWFKYERVE